MRKGHPVLFTFWKDIIPTKVLRTTGIEEAYDFFFFPLFQPTGKSYWWQSSGWVSGWNDSWLERNKLCLKSQDAVSTRQKPFQMALVWEDQLWYQKLCWGKALRTITNPPKHSHGLWTVPEALHRACCILWSSCWGSFVSIQARSGFFAVPHSYLLIWVLISSYGCHFSQLWPQSCKKWRCKLWFYFSPKLCFLWRVYVEIELQAFVHERRELFPLERRTWSRLRI